MLKIRYRMLNMVVSMLEYAVFMLKFFMKMLNPLNASEQTGDAEEWC
ncbi:hypothetical protein GH754_07505 [Salinibacillus xinjiangensis]|uniref:Uncharacterized protein n=1 Tax=Salinibacillus xinjiangensis TaxID=1229268 RepID=A0A6G1X5G8_9BACI|nr:hypothetical protein [Salinibacillus xinjiangensis]